MKLEGFVGPTYQLDSESVDSQRLMNLYPEMIESGRGKEARQWYFKSTPGFSALDTVGDGPIRCVHVDGLDRILVVSGNKIYLFTERARWGIDIYPTQGAVFNDLDQSTDINTGTDTFTITTASFDQSVYVVQVSSDGTLPTGLSANTDYYIYQVTATTYRFATSLANALAGTPIDITATGSGTMSVQNQGAYYTPSILDINYASNITFGTGNFSSTAHGLLTGMEIRLHGTAPIPTELATGTNYYVIKVDDDNFKLASSLSNANAGTALTLTEEDAGTLWYASRPVNDMEFIASPSHTMDTSTGKVTARSMSLDGDGSDSATIFVDGTKSYVFYKIAADSDAVDEAGTGYILEDNRQDLGDGGSDTQLGPPATHAAWIDGFYILNKVNTGQFFVSDRQSTYFSTLNFTSSEGNPDLIVGLIENYRDLWVFNETSTEVFVNTGNAVFPFERVQGGFIEIGCCAKYSIAQINGSVFWIGQTKDGRGTIYMASGLQPRRISTHAIEQAIAGYSDITTAEGYTYEWKGHFFYVLNFDEATWVYDMKTGMWHERSYTNGGSYERHRGNFYAFYKYQGIHIIADYSTNDLYQLSDSVYDDDGDAITRMRAAPFLSSDLKLVFCRQFQLDMETGVGLVSGQGSDPQVVLDWSDDKGNTWSNESWTSAGGQTGGIGDYLKRVIWRRLGRFRQRVFRVKITDPVEVTMLGAHVELERGAS